MSIGLILSLGIPLRSLMSVLLTRGAQLMLALALLLATSITTIMTTMFGFGVYVILTSGHYRRGALQLTVIAVFCLCSAIGWSTIKSKMFEVTGRDESLSGRDSLWSIVAKEGTKRPIFGSGFGAFWTEGKGRELVHTWNPRQSHSAFLDLWMDLGIVGVIIFLFAYPGTLVRRWLAIRGPPGSARRRATSALYATAISYMLIYSTAESYFLALTGFPFTALTWIILLVGNPDANCIENEFASDTEWLP